VGTKKKALALAFAGAGLIVLAILIVRLIAGSAVSIRGAVVTSDTDPARELPVADVEVTVIGGPAVDPVRSDASGFFTIPIPLQRRVRGGLPVTLRFHHPDYQPLEFENVGGDELCIAHLTPVVRTAPGSDPRREVTIANVVARYSINTTSIVNVGSAVKTFEVVNIANVPCKGHRPCSPDGKWKAAIGSAVIDADPGNEFHNARVSCIAGPCPFTRIEANNLSSSSRTRTLRVSALNWSETATFLLEAEVYKEVTSDVLRQSYPLVFGQALTFTLPAAAEGVSIQAELDKNPIVFPLGPSLILSWANCQVQVNKDQTRVYRCELKPDYRFS
jgi:hypothetical protein